MENEIKKEENISQPVEQPKVVEPKVEEKMYSQAEVQAEVDKQSAGLRRRYEKQILELKREPVIRKTLLEIGCNKDAINDFITLNKKDLFECEDNKLSEVIKQKTEQYKYMFDKKPFAADPLSQFQVDENKEVEAKAKTYNKFFGK